MDPERKLKIGKVGGLSEIVLSHFTSKLEDMKWDIMNKMLMHYRSEKLDHDHIIGLLGEMNSIEELLRRLEKDVKNSRNLDKEHLS